MKKGVWPLWFKALVIIFFLFVILEAILRLTNLGTILPVDLLNTLNTSLGYYVLLLNNLILFSAVIIFLAVLASYYTRDIPQGYNLQLKKDKTVSSSLIYIEKATSHQHEQEGKGLILGAVIAFIYTAIDFFIIKRYMLPICHNLCGIENLFAVICAFVYFIIGLSLIRAEGRISREKEVVVKEDNA